MMFIFFAKLTCLSASSSKRCLTDSLDDCCVDRALLIRGLGEALPNTSPWKDNAYPKMYNFKQNRLVLRTT